MERRTFLKALAAIATGPAVIEQFAKLEHKRKYFPGWSPNSLYDSLCDTTQLRIGQWHQFRIGDTVAINGAAGPEFFRVTGISDGVLSVHSPSMSRTSVQQTQLGLRRIEAHVQPSPSFAHAMRPRALPAEEFLRRYRGTVP